MRLKVAENASQTDLFKNKIADVLQKSKTSRGKRLMFHITGIEEDAGSIDEEKKSVEDELDIPVNVTSLRLAKFGSKTATITATKCQEKCCE